MHIQLVLEWKWDDARQHSTFIQIKRDQIHSQLRSVEDKGVETYFPGVSTVVTYGAATMNADELLKRYAIGDRDFTGANLTKAKFIGAHLVGVKLWGANLYEANLAKAKLWGANLCGANLGGANLTRANLCGANLVGANLRQAKLKYTKLYGANLSGACYDESTQFSPGFDPASRNMRKV